MNKTKSNRFEGAHLIGRTVTLSDGSGSGVVTHAGYGLVSVDLTVGHWWCGPVRYVVVS